MELKHRLFSCDSHGQIRKDAFTSRMSRSKFGDKIPEVREIDDKSKTGQDGPVERWMIGGRIIDNRAPSNCPALWKDPRRMKGPQRWEDVPVAAYDPKERLKIIDGDGVDGEVLFPNPPVQSGGFFQGDAEFERACIQAYNDAMAEWHQTSERFVPLAMVPLLGSVDDAVAEVNRLAKMGFRGITITAEPTAVAKAQDAFTSVELGNPALRNLKHFCDPHWEKLWAACQDAQIAIHWHGHGGINMPLPVWKEWEEGQFRAVVSTALLSTLGQFIPHLVLSGVLERYPRLHWVCAETGVGWLAPVMDILDHVWERNHLWSDGITTRPSEQIRRQVHIGIWYENHAMAVRNKIGVDNLMWMTDFPHNVTTYPNTRQAVERVLAGIPAGERDKITHQNWLRLYGRN